MSPICVPGDPRSCPGTGVLPPPWAVRALERTVAPAPPPERTRRCISRCDKKAGAREARSPAQGGPCPQRRTHRTAATGVRPSRRGRVAAARQKPPTGASDTAHLQLSSPPVADPQRLGLGRASAPRAWRKGANRRGAFPGGFADHSVRFDALLGIAWRPNRRADMLTQPILDGATIGTLLAPAPSRRAGMRAGGRAAAASGKAGHGRRQP